MILLIDKVNKQIDYFKALILFYSNLLRVRKAKNIKNHAYLNILADNLIYFDIICYKNLLKDEKFNFEFNYLHFLTFQTPIIN